MSLPIRNNPFFLDFLFFLGKQKQSPQGPDPQEQADESPKSYVAAGMGCNETTKDGIEQVNEQGRMQESSRLKIRFNEI